MYKKLFLVILFLVCLLLVVILPAKLIKISKIVCQSQYGDCPTDINTRLETLVSKNLVESKKLAAGILKDNFLVSDFSTQFNLPTTLKVNLVIRKAVFALHQEGTNNFSLIDKEGYVVAISDSSNLPRVVSPDKLKNVGEKTTDKDLAALKIIEGVYSMYQVQKGTIMEESLTVELPSQIRVIFPLGTYDRDVLLGELRLIYSKIETEEGGKYKEIDLRFKNPVLR